MMLREPELEFQSEWEFESEDEWEFESEDELDGELNPDIEAELEDELELPGAQYEVIGRDTRQLVGNTRAAPFRYICNLVYDGAPMCTGTLIGPRTVLTAGHCLAGLDPRRMRVLAGRNGPRAFLAAAHAARFQLAPGFSPVTPTDYGVIQLREPIGRTVGYWTMAYSRSATDPVGRSVSARPLPLAAGKLNVNLSGYPADKCVTLAGPPPRKVCGTQQWRAYNRTVRLAGGMLHYLNDTFPGHSGSPVWVKRSPDMGGRVLIAIHVAGDDPKIRGKANRAVRLTPAILANIRRWLLLASGPTVPGAPSRPIPGTKPRTPVGSREF